MKFKLIQCWDGLNNSYCWIVQSQKKIIFPVWTSWPHLWSPSKSVNLAEKRHTFFQGWVRKCVIFSPCRLLAHSLQRENSLETLKHNWIISKLGCLSKLWQSQARNDSSREAASICCLHRIGLSRDECIHDWGQLDLTGECWESGRQENKRDECVLSGAAREMEIAWSAKNQVDLFLPFISWKQIQRGLSFLLLVGLQRRALQGCPSSSYHWLLGSRLELQYAVYLPQPLLNDCVSTSWRKPWSNLQ